MSTQQESKRPVILAKKDDKDAIERTRIDSNESTNRSAIGKPKILLKLKDEKTTKTPQQISIVARPTDALANESKTNNSSQKSIITLASAPSTSQKDMKDISLVNGPETVASQNVLAMKEPITLITGHYQINNLAFDHIMETNTAFFVVGVIGPQGVGKSTILNILGSKNAQSINWADFILSPSPGGATFKTRAPENALSTVSVTEGIEMFITKDRTILLDCSPVLCNQHKQEITLSEIDDLKMIMFLLNVCHKLIVVEDGTDINLSLIRLIQCAEKMKQDYDREGNDFYSPNVIFVKNMCSNRDYLESRQDDINSMYKHLFKNSALKIGVDIYFDSSIRDADSLKNRRINIVYIPLVDPNGK